MSELRGKAAVLAVFGIVAAVLLVRAARRPPAAVPPAATSAPAEASVEANVEASVVVADASPVDAAVVEEEEDAAPDAGAAGWCARLAHRTDAAMSAVRAAIHDADWKAPDLCVSSARGTWALVVERAVTSGPPGEAASSSIRFAVALVHVDAEGHETSVLPNKELHDTWKLDGGSLVTNVSLEPTWGSIALAVLGTFDYDGDGESEILLEGHAADEGANRHTTEAWTFHDGKVVPYGPLRGVEILAVEDVDNDGRPDVVSAGPYARVQAVSGIGGTYRVAPPLFARHSLPGGAFSEADAVARDFSRSKCPRKPLLDFGTGPGATQFNDDVAESVVCARLWGATAAEIRRAWEAVCAGIDAGNDVECQAWPKQLGAIAPPFTLK
jgi:hypothetical protein